MPSPALPPPASVPPPSPRPPQPLPRSGAGLSPSPSTSGGLQPHLARRGRLEAAARFRITPGQSQRVRPARWACTRRCRCPPACWWTLRPAPAADHGGLHHGLRPAWRSHSPGPTRKRLLARGVLGCGTRLTFVSVIASRPRTSPRARFPLAVSVTSMLAWPATSSRTIPLTLLLHAAADPVVRGHGPDLTGTGVAVWALLPATAGGGSVRRVP